MYVLVYLSMRAVRVYSPLDEGGKYFHFYTTHLQAYIHYKQAQPPKTITELVASKICICIIKNDMCVYTYLCSRGSV